MRMPSNRNLILRAADLRRHTVDQPCSEFQCVKLRLEKGNNDIRYMPKLGPRS